MCSASSIAPANVGDLDEDLADGALSSLQLVGRYDRLELIHRRVDLVLVEQVSLLLLAQVTEPDLHQETVELGLG